MFPKSALVLAVVAVAKLAVATPPACILGAVGSQPDPTDFGTICSGKVATNIQSYLSSNCDSSANDAQKAFADTCNQAGHKVAAVSVSASPSATAAPSTSLVVFTSKFVGSDGVTHTTVATATSLAGNSAATKTAGGSGSSSTASGAASAGNNVNGALVKGIVAFAGLLAAL